MLLKHLKINVENWKRGKEKKDREEEKVVFYSPVDLLHSLVDSVAVM